MLSRYGWLLAGLIAALGVGAMASDKRKPPPTAPVKPIQLFNGRDLTGFTSWLKKTGHDDPRKVFSVADGMIHVTGEDNGYLATDKEYRDYRLTVEYKWGKRTDGGKFVRNSGILLHATGPDGNSSNGTWMACFECQLAQGCAGDIIVIPGKDQNGAAIPVTHTAETVLRRTKGRDGKRAARLECSLKSSSGGQTTIPISRSCSTPAARTTSRALWESGIA